MENYMSYFSAEKKLKLAVLGIHTSGIDTLTSSFADTNIFSTETQVQLASSIGYPVITTTGAQIDFEAGWKYVIDVRLRGTDTSPSTTEYIQYILTDMSNNQLSSAGSIAFYRDVTYSHIQEKCLLYLDCTSAATSIKLRALKGGGGVGGGLNVTGDPGNASFRAHIIIKAWR
jgi:hypothetical protein